MTAENPQFLFDVGSPNAYLSHLVIPGIEQRTGAKFEYVPILLGGIFKMTNNRSPMEAFGGVKNKLEFQALETRRFLQRYHLQPYATNPFFPVNTLLLMRGAVAAQLEGVFERYVDAAFHHMWGEPKKMDDPEIAVQAMTASGLDAARLFARTKDDTIKNRLMANTQQAVARGAFGSPTFFVGDEMFFGKEQLRDVEDMLNASKTKC
jgi:2-hydroxychromene-2-carboxylate isomerase